MNISNPDIQSDAINPMNSHTRMGFSSTAVGGRRRRRRTKTRRTKTRRTKRRTRKMKSKRHRKRRQRGGLNPTYRSYSASFDPGKNGMYANGPSVGNILEQFN